MPSALKAAVRRDPPDRLIERASVSIDRLPTLRAILQALAEHCSASVQRISAAPVRISLRGVTGGRAGDVLGGYGKAILFGDLHAADWNAHVLVGCDQGFVLTLVETLFGGDGVEPPIERERAFSNVERHFAAVVFEYAAEALQASFAAAGPTACRFERMVAAQDVDLIAKPSSLGVLARMTLQAIGRGGEMFVLIPQAALAPMRSSLARDPSGDQTGRDPRWSQQFEKELGRATVGLRAVMAGGELTLGDIAGLKVGQLIPIAAPSRGRVQLECNGRVLFWCQLGQSDGHYTLRVESSVDQEQEFIDDLLRH